VNTNSKGYSKPGSCSPSGVEPLGHTSTGNVGASPMCRSRSVRTNEGSTHSPQDGFTWGTGLVGVTRQADPALHSSSGGAPCQEMHCLESGPSVPLCVPYGGPVASPPPDEELARHRTLGRPRAPQTRQTMDRGRHARDEVRSEPQWGSHRLAAPIRRSAFRGTARKQRSRKPPSRDQVVMPLTASLCVALGRRYRLGSPLQPCPRLQALPEQDRHVPASPFKGVARTEQLLFGDPRCPSAPSPASGRPLFKLPGLA
jgi:hypothetical protein